MRFRFHVYDSKTKQPLSTDRLQVVVRDWGILTPVKVVNGYSDWIDIPRERLAVDVLLMGYDVKDVPKDYYRNYSGFFVVTSDYTTIDIPMIPKKVTPPEVVKFRVINTETKAPVAGAYCVLKCRFPGGGTCPFDGTTGSDGYVEIDTEGFEVLSWTVEHEEYETAKGTGKPPSVVELRPKVTPPPPPPPPPPPSPPPPSPPPPPTPPPPTPPPPTPPPKVPSIVEWWRSLSTLQKGAVIVTLGIGALFGVWKWKRGS